MEIQVLKRSGQPTSEMALPHHPRRESKAAVEKNRHMTPHVQQLHLDQSLEKTSLMCEKCREIRLGELLAAKSPEMNMGLLDSFSDADCQLCGTIQHFVNLYWGSQRPSVNKIHQPQLYMESKKWSSLTDSNSSDQPVYRLLLTLDQRPLKSEPTWRAPAYNRKDRFVLTELELHPERLPTVALSQVPSLRRTIQPFVDLDLIRSWLDQCQSHKKCNNIRTSQRLNSFQFFAHGLRLIDVVEERLVEKTDPCAYIALSYVWGHLEPPPLCTNRQNLKALLQNLPLHPVEEDLGAEGRCIPRAIVDTMAFCRSIGQRYLWVDSLCIIQDDPDEKRRLIHGMDCVYENASLTVVALSGSDADAGLAGISSLRDPDSDNSGRPYLSHEGYNTHSIGIVRPSLHEQIESSYWNSRGWTYQEQLLSARKLYFTPNEVFYQCGSYTRREGYGFENFTRHSARPGPPWIGGSSLRNSERVTYSMKLPHSGPWSLDQAKSYDRHFQTILSTFSRRSLTHPGDVLNALTGIYNKYYTAASADAQDVGLVALQGTPARCFSKALLWFAAGTHQGRRSNVNQSRPSSWSWTSWIAPIDFAAAAGMDYMAQSLVENWSLTFHNGKAVETARFSDRHYYHILKIPSWYRDITPDELLGFFSSGSHEDHAAVPTPIVPGLLDFRAPFIPIPSAAVSSWAKGSDGVWNFKVGADLCAVVRLDPGEDTASVNAFVLLLFDTSYLGLCLKKAGEYFERVGVAIFTQMRAEWERFVKQDLLDLCWKRILLR